MNVKINWDEGVFAVPDKVADGLKLASAKSLRLLLYYLKNRSFPDDPAVIGAGNDDIEDAVNYWQQVGVFLKCDGDGTDTGHSAKTAVKPEDSTASTLPGCRSGSSSENEPADGNAPAVINAPSDGRTVAEAAGSRSHKTKKSPAPGKALLPSEIADRISKSPDVAFMFTTAESELKRMLTFDDQRTLLWLHDHLGMSADVVTMITAYCCRHGRASMAKIEEAAINMFERDIVTHENVNRELAAMEKRSSYEGRVKSRLGIQTTITPRQREYVDDWCSKNISVELAVKAYYITMETKGKADFRYMNGILMKWYSGGVTTPEAADSFDDREKAAPVQKSPVRRGGKAKGQSPSYDMSLMFGEDEGAAPSYDLKGMFSED